MTKNFAYVFSVTLILLFCPFNYALGEEMISPSIFRTDLYPSGARIVFVIPASGEIQFQLPAAFDISSIRPLTSSKVKIKSFETAEVSRPEWIPPALETLFSEIQGKKRNRDILSGKIIAIESSLELISPPLPKELKGSEVAEYIESIRMVREKMEMERIITSESLDGIIKELSFLQSEFESKMPPNAYKAINVRAIVSGEGDLLVEAFTPYAEWHPFYRMNLDSTSSTISGTMFGRARQRTGLLLEGKVFFNTAMPSMSTTLPSLLPIVADLAPKTRARAMGEAVPVTAAMKDAPTPPPPSSPLVSETLTNLSVSAEGILTGDFSVTDFNLGDFSLESSTSIISIPYLSEEAWIIAKSKQIPFALLPGKVELSVDGQTSGTTSLIEHGSGSNLELAFGKTPRLRTIRKRIIPKEGSTWTGRGRTEDGYTIEVSNEMPYPVIVKVKDRIPISSRENITVETVSIVPSPDEHSEDNMLTWHISLDQGEKRVISVTFRLLYPSDETLVFR